MKTLPSLLLIAFTVSFAACSPTAETPNESDQVDHSTDVISTSTEATTDIDLQAWLVEAREVSTRTESAELDDQRVSQLKELAVELNEAADWMRACDTYVDYETGEEIYDPIPMEGSHWVRGLIEVADITGSEALVAITCDFGAYQGSYSLVHIADESAFVVKAPQLDENGQPTERLIGAFSTPSFEGIEQGFFQTYGKARGLGDCGTFASYQIGSEGLATIHEVRDQGCEYEGDPIVEPENWPVVYNNG